MSTHEPPATPAGGGRRAIRRRVLREVASRAPFSDVPGPFPRTRPETSLGDQPTAAQERGMRAFWWDGFWANVPETILVSYLGLYILDFGGSSGQVGFVTACSSLFAALAFFPGARFVETFGHRKAIVVISGGGLGRVALLGLAGVPVFAGGDTAIWLVLAFVSLRGFFGYFALPAWTSLTADVVPIGIRGRFLASRNFGMSLSALATLPVAGYLLDRFSGLGGWQIVWLLAFGAGVAATWAYAAIPDPTPHADVIPHDRRSRDGFLADVLADRRFVFYLAGTGAWNIALHAGAPFFNVYLAERLGASSLWIGVLAALPSITGLAGLVYFGRAMDRRGTRWTMMVTGLLIPTLPAMWLVVTEPWHVIFINAYGGVLWAGYQLAALNMLMVMSPAEKRPRYAAAYHAVVFAAAFVGPIAGGQIIESIGFQALFVVSAAGRLIGTLVIMRFVADPEVRSERPIAAPATPDRE